MILERPEPDPAAFAERLGWQLKPEGLCRDDVCVLIGDRSSAAAVAAALRRPLVEDAEHGLWSVGPETGRALARARAPELTLPEWRGGELSLSSLYGQKVLLLAWAPW